MIVIGTREFVHEKGIIRRKYMSVVFLPDMGCESLKTEFRDNENKERIYL